MNVLYRKYRPRDFNSVFGQDNIVRAIKNQIINNHMGHAYLFCGARGTGKTTMAKLLSKAVNCENPIEGNACGKCPTCKAIDEGRVLSVVELDAASNNGVDDIRTIKEEIAYPPTMGRYKVYIIDEVHMLTTAAFNALLKTLEEPPSYCIFILATTDINKLPATILSRCQRYDFRLIPSNIIYNRLKEIAKMENLSFEDSALHYISELGDGSLRDALSILDQALAIACGNKLEYDMLLKLFRAVDSRVYTELLQNICDNNIEALLETYNDAIDNGADFQNLLQGFISFLRSLLILKSAPSIDSLVDVSEERAKEMQAINISPLKLVNILEGLNQLSVEIKTATHKRLFMELSLVSMASGEIKSAKENINNLSSNQSTTGDIDRRMALLERRLGELERENQGLEERLKAKSYENNQHQADTVKNTISFNNIKADNDRNIKSDKPKVLRENMQGTSHIIEPDYLKSDSLVLDLDFNNITNGARIKLDDIKEAEGSIDDRYIDENSFPDAREIAESFKNQEITGMAWAKTIGIDIDNERKLVNLILFGKMASCLSGKAEEKIKEYLKSINRSDYNCRIASHEKIDYSKIENTTVFFENKGEEFEKIINSKINFDNIVKEED